MHVIENLQQYSFSNITTTLIQISRLFYFGFFSKTNHQILDKKQVVQSPKSSKICFKLTATDTSNFDER